MNTPLPAPAPRSRALTIPPARQQLNLAVAVSGSAGGVLLLSTNLFYLWLAPPLGGPPWIPLSANLALLFGGAMFAREYRRGRQK